VLVLVDHEFQIDVVPPSERPRGFADVLLGVVADAHGEQLHDFAGEILVGSPFDIDPGVQECQHSRVLRHSHGEIPEIAGSLFLV
jgi:hypothetical protein